MKKQLNTEAIQNELAGSVFFPRSEKKEAISVSSQSAIQPVRTDDVCKHASNHASVIASMLAQTPEIIEEVRKTVKGVGKEVVYVRLT